MAGLVLGTLGLMAVSAIPTTIGVGQAISAQKRQNATQKEQEKIHLTALFPGDEEFFCVLVGGQVRGSLQVFRCILQRGPGTLTFILLTYEPRQILIDHPDEPVPGHRFSGYHFTYPGDEGHRGLVSTIAEDPPMLNWIFVSTETRNLRFGGKKDSADHIVGPWGWSADERFLILEGSDKGFLAVREEREDGSRQWAVYWDPDGALTEKMDEESCVEIKLRRRPVLGMESRYVKGEKE
jgi:hypothetical protein